MHPLLKQIAGHWGKLWLVRICTEVSKKKFTRYPSLIMKVIIFIFIFYQWDIIYGRTIKNQLFVNAYYLPLNFKQGSNRVTVYLLMWDYPLAIKSWSAFFTGALYSFVKRG